MKKQTVWLLTMLSLVVVLSVFYVTSPTEPTNMLSVGTSEEEGKENTEGSEGEEGTDEEASASGEEVVMSGDDAFAQMRLDMTIQRDKMREDLTAVVASADVTAEDKNAAYDKMQELTEVATKESYLEMMIKTLGYDDALVRALESEVKVTVKATEQSTAEANKIIQLVKDEMGSLYRVAVEFQPIEQ
ncbi:SpoIIIAH-like family protein [Bacillus coahuilensis]|uniref:SpoIIIAH-like family protein n=1 Tax=Bacillus coahuilensis TaxID=408580 RepID=UPI003078E3D9